MGKEEYTAHIERVGFSFSVDGDDMVFTIENDERVYKINSGEKQKLNPDFLLTKTGDYIKFTCKEKKSMFSKKVELEVKSMSNETLNEKHGNTVKIFEKR